jgi:osmotically inducible protein OsmC
MFVALEESHGHDQAAFHRHGHRDRRAERPHPSQRWLGERRPFGAESHGRSRQTGNDEPEHLFAAGYAACFGGALDFVGKQHKKDATKARITADVSIGPRDGGGFGLAVKLRVEDSTLPQAELAALAKEAHEKICPYSHATRGNVDVQVEVKGA